MRADIRNTDTGNSCPMKTTEPQHLFTPHQLTALRYRFLVGDVELTPLRVLASHTLPWNEWQITLYILGASHAVRLERDDVSLTELLTCLPPIETQNALLTLDADTHRENNLETNNLCCRVRLQPFPLEEGDTLCHTPPENSLALTYPPIVSKIQPFARCYAVGVSREKSAGVENKADVTPLPMSLSECPGEGPGVRSLPITRIGWRFAEDSLLIETIHTYPEEGRGLRSLTRFTPTGGR
jgi:hypothetical protein